MNECNEDTPNQVIIKTVSRIYLLSLSIYNNGGRKLNNFNLLHGSSPNSFVYILTGLIHIANLGLL